MSLSANPSKFIGFNRPFSQNIQETVTLTNHDDKPIVFKIKTTAPSHYSVRPVTGRIESGDSLDVLVTKQAMDKEPPQSERCGDRFIVKYATVEQPATGWNVAEIWANAKDFHRIKLSVKYLGPVEPVKGKLVQLNPRSSITFSGPFTHTSKSALTITNPNPQLVAFKVKTTNFKDFYVRPNMGRIRARETCQVSIVRRVLGEDPTAEGVPKIKHKFLILSMVVEDDDEKTPTEDLFRAHEGEEGAKVYSQKLKAVYVNYGEKPDKDGTVLLERRTSEETVRPDTPEDAKYEYKDCTSEGPLKGGNEDEEDEDEGQDQATLVGRRSDWVSRTLRRLFP